MGPQVDHRLDGKHVSRPYFGTLTRLAVIWYLRVFVHTAPNPVTNVLTYNRVAPGLGMLLHCRPNVSQVPSRPTLLDREIQTLLSYANQRQPFGAYFANRDRRRCIANEAFNRYAAI